jgi:hypothetical protein
MLQSCERPIRRHCEATPAGANHATLAESPQHQHNGPLPRHDAADCAGWRQLHPVYGGKRTALQNVRDMRGVLHSHDQPH